MKCPVDQTTLQMTERSGVEIDYCPECRGIWLDRGELDKIIEKAEQQQPTQQSARYVERSSSDDQRRDDHDDHHDEHKYYDDRSSQGKKKKGSFIGDIFGGFGED